MENSFIREINIIEREKINDYQDLVDNIEEIKKNLEKSYNNIQFVKDQNLIDYYTYKIKSEESRYDFLINEAKKIEEKHD